ncbi:MAG: hypothetical protein WA485_25275, partial [Candidatus Sulfotelmatobacter sp.]
MLRFLSGFVCLSVLFLSSAFATVNVSSPSNGGTYTGPVQFNATGTTNCSKGVGSMGIYTAPGVLAYVVNGDTINTSLTLNPATYNTVITEWDNCGGSTTAVVKITVQPGGGSGVSIISPTNNSTVGSPVNFKATATTTCSKGVSSMGIYTAPYHLVYTVQGANLNTNLSLSPGTYNAVVEEWDGCGGAATASVKFTVNGGNGGGTFSQIQHAGGWGEAGQRAPKFINCSPSPCDNITFSMAQNIKNPSLSGEATQYNLGGSQGYGDGFWNNHLIGPFSSQGMPDTDQKIVPTLHNFTYDVYFWTGDVNLAQAVEFDINQFFNNTGYIWGHECRVAGGNEWDIWDNLNAKWVPTGISCYPNSNSWNHLTIQVQRTSNNQLLYQSITLNGQTHTLNWTF